MPQYPYKYRHLWWQRWDRVDDLISKRDQIQINTDRFLQRNTDELIKRIKEIEQWYGGRGQQLDESSRADRLPSDERSHK